MRYINVSTTLGKCKEPVWNVEDFPIESIHIEWKKINKKKYVKYYAMNVFMTFDIETTTKYSRDIDGNILEPVAWMYHFQFCIDNKVVFGRTWEEFIYFIERLQYIGIDSDHIILCFVHNLAFEFQFIRRFLTWESVFARKKRKPIKAQCFEGIEFRCSYILSNMSLEKFCENEKNVIHCKNVGVYNYQKIRTPKTEMTEIEESYCYNDVRGLYECIESRLQEDTIITLPLTSTGYVRRQYMEAMKADKKAMKTVRAINVSRETYRLLKEAFRGGDTHANAYWVNELLENIDSWDISSSYPYAMMTGKYPMKTFEQVNPVNLLEWESKKDYALLMHIKIDNPHYIGKTGMPYISFSKCQNVKKSVNDNGRILCAESLEMTCTDIDLKIIREVYKFDALYCSRLYVSKYEYLPEPIRKTLLQLFTEKTMLKGLPDKEYEYMKSKNRVNGSYGMMVTDVLQDEITYNGDWGEEEVDIEEKLEKYNKSRNRFLAYQWGVWVTAHARYNLHRGREPLSRDVIYSDTDSNKVFNGHSDFYENLNRIIIEEIENSPIAPMVKKGNKTVYMGTWEHDAHYDEYKTMGAKKYCYREDGKIKVTVAGLSKKLGAKKMNELGHVDDFKLGMIFDPSGNMTAYYNDDEIHQLEINGCTFTTASNLALIHTTYILGITGEYKEILKNIKENA